MSVEAECAASVSRSVGGFSCWFIWTYWLQSSVLICSVTGGTPKSNCMVKTGSGNELSWCTGGTLAGDICSTCLVSVWISVSLVSTCTEVCCTAPMWSTGSEWLVPDVCGVTW